MLPGYSEAFHTLLERPDPIYAVLLKSTDVSRGGETRKGWQWQEVQPAPGGAWIDVYGGRYGGQVSHYAFESGRWLTARAGDVVELRQGFQTADLLDFDYWFTAPIDARLPNLTGDIQDDTRYDLPSARSQWQKYTVSLGQFLLGDLSNGGSTSEVNLFALNPRQFLSRVIIQAPAAFGISGSQILCDVRLKAYDGSDLVVDQFISQADLRYTYPTIAPSTFTGYVNFDIPVIAFVRLNTVSTIDTLTTGQVDVYFEVSSLPE